MLGVYMALLETDEDRERFNSLYLRYRDQLYRIALSVMKDVCAAEDIVSDVFMTIAQNFEKLRGKTEEELNGYVVIITRNRAIDVYRRQKTEAERVSFDDACTHTVLMQDAPTGEPEGAEGLIPQLSGEYRDVLMLKYYYGFSVQEVANMLHLPYNTVKSRMKRAKQLLKEGISNSAK